MCGSYFNSYASWGKKKEWPASLSFGETMDMSILELGALCFQVERPWAPGQIKGDGADLAGGRQKSDLV